METIILRHQLYLERLKAGYGRNMSKTIRQVERRIIEVVRDIEQPNMADVTKKQLQSILSELRTIQLDLYSTAISGLLGDLKSLASYEAQFEGRVLRSANRRIRVKLPKANAAFREAVTRPMQSTGELLEPFIREWASKEIAAVENVIRKGYVSGWTNQQMQQAIRGTKARNYRDGVLKRAEKHAETITRTAVQHVASTARGTTWAANADIVEKYRVIATLDDRTSQICRSLDQQVFEVGKGPMPPYHPNCRSTTVPVLAKEFDFLDEGATRSSMEGYVDADTTYYDWLKKQPASFQDSVLGPTRGKLFREGGLTTEEFRRLNIGKKLEPLTLAQMRELEPEAFRRAGL